MKADSNKIILFYKFVDIKNPEKIRDEQRKICESLELTGRFLIAEEGINATLEGTATNIRKYKSALKKIPKFKDVVVKESVGTGKAFSRLSVKVRDEVVTLGAGKFNVKKETAKTVTATELENMYRKNEDFVVLDLRNKYEIEAGYFEKTVHPNLDNFRDLPKKLSTIKDLKNQKVVAVCTGGIRCEKATCLLKKEGFKNLYQLEDGIHTYMQKYPNRHFKGSLFVFDNRMVTRVADKATADIVGKCFACGKACEDFYADDSQKPSKKVICCKKCIKKYAESFRKCAV